MCIRHPWGGATLVCPQIDDVERVRAALEGHRIKGAFRGTAIRFLYARLHDKADIEKAAAVIGPLVTLPAARS